MSKKENNQYNLIIQFSEYKEAVEKLKSIAHPLRLAIVECLYNYKKLTVSELQKHLDLPQPIVSHHLIKLKDSNVVDSKRDGKFKVHFLKNEPQKYLQFNLIK